MIYSDTETDISSLTRRMCILGWITLVVSVICIVLGIVSVSVSESQADFPFSAGGAMVAGISALILSCCPVYLYIENKRFQGSSTTGCFDCCVILLVVWFSITILAVCFGFGLAGIYAVVVCTSEEEKLKRVCSSATSTKLAISLVTIIATFILIILSLAIFFTCCCNAAKFGMPILDTTYTSDFYNYSIEQSRHVRDLRRQQEIDLQETLSEARMERERAERRNISNNIPREEPSAPYISDNTDPADRGESSLSDPPPSYEEVMRKEQSSETAV